MSLQERLSQYKNKELANTVVLTIAQSQPFLDYLASKVSPADKDPTNAFGTKQFAVGMKLAEDLYTSIPINKISVYGTRLVIFLTYPEYVTKVLTLLASRATEALCFQYPKPKINQECWLLPDYEKIHFDRMWQYIWIARRNRILGELHLEPSIPASSRMYPHTEIAQAVFQSSSFSFESLDHMVDTLYPSVVKYGRWYDGSWHENNGK